MRKRPEGRRKRRTEMEIKWNFLIVKSFISLQPLSNEGAFGNGEVVAVANLMSSRWVRGPGLPDAGLNSHQFGCPLISARELFKLSFYIRRVISTAARANI